MAIVKQVPEILGAQTNKVVDDHPCLKGADGRCLLHNGNQHLDQSMSKGPHGKGLATPLHVSLHESPLKLLVLDAVLFPPVVYPEYVPRIVDEAGLLGYEVQPQDDPTIDHEIGEQSHSSSQWCLDRHAQKVAPPELARILHRLFLHLVPSSLTPPS
jgi:hypothetical protein